MLPAKPEAEASVSCERELGRRVPTQKEAQQPTSALHTRRRALLTTEMVSVSHPTYAAVL